MFFVLISEMKNPRDAMKVCIDQRTSLILWSETGE